jgi:dephospho-CoA kinase
MLKVALTGGIATGKSYVLERFRQRGITCVDADALAHGVMSAGTEATTAIAERFGPDILAADGSVDRGRLGPIVFGDASARRELEAIVHPAVYRAIAASLRAFERLGDVPLIVVDVPLLYETGHAGDFDRVIATTCSRELQLLRLIDRGLTREKAAQRLAAQLPSEEKARRADFTIQTGGTFEDTDAQVERALTELTQGG